MKEYLTGWIVNLTLFSLLSSMTGKLLPGKCYQPYIRVFCGMVTLLLLLDPILSLTGLKQKIETSVKEDLYQLERQELENDLIKIEEEQKREWEERYREYMQEAEELDEKQAGNQERE